MSYIPSLWILFTQTTIFCQVISSYAVEWLSDLNESRIRYNEWLNVRKVCFLHWRTKKTLQHVSACVGGPARSAEISLVILIMLWLRILTARYHAPLSPWSVQPFSVNARSTACERAITNLDNARRDATLKYYRML